MLSCDYTIPKWSTAAATAATGVQSSQTITAVALMVRTTGHGLLCVTHHDLCSQAYVVYGGYAMYVEQTTNVDTAQHTPHITPYSISHRYRFLCLPLVHRLQQQVNGPADQGTHFLKILKIPVGAPEADSFGPAPRFWFASFSRRLHNGWCRDAQGWHCLHTAATILEQFTISMA